MIRHQWRKPLPARLPLWLGAAAAYIAIFALSGTANAHGVHVFAWVADGTVHVESKFSGGRNPQKARIEVLAPDGQPLLEGHTATDGTFSFPVPQPTALRIVLHAGTGHRAEWTLSEADVRESESGTAPAVTARGPLPEAAQSPPEGDLSPQSIERIVDRALDQKLKPVMTMLAESRQQRPGIRDIVGGIGYIIGLVGLAAYLRNRPRSR